MIPGSDEEKTFQAKRRSRNIAIGLVLAALVVLFYAITIARMS